MTPRRGRAPVWSRSGFFSSRHGGGGQATEAITKVSDSTSQSEACAQDMARVVAEMDQTVEQLSGAIRDFITSMQHSG